LSDGNCANNETCVEGICTLVEPCDNDPDGDGRGEGCPAGTDCDEGDPEVFREIDLFVDEDEDNVGVGPAESLCLGNVVPRGFTDITPEADDCDDKDETIFRSAELYVDGDEDGVGVGAPTPVCLGETTPPGFVDEAPEADDCDDEDRDVFRLVALATDGDEDGVGVGDAADTCIGADIPAGLTEVPVVDDDCDDGDSTVFALLSLHADSDGDGVGLGAVELVCTDGTVPVGFTDVTPATADCDDFDGARAPGNPEVCDGLDNSCSGSADDGGVCPCPVLYDGGNTLRPYLACGDARSWAHAEAACARLPHYTLLKVDDQAENDFIRANNLLDHWMGLNDFAVEGTEVWLDGTEPAQFFFDSGEPNGNGDCFYMRAGGWSDHPCEEHRGFICEAHPERRDVAAGCVDGDGDGFGANCILGEDCDDGDENVFGWLVGFADNDQDGFTAPYDELVCTDGALPATFVPAASGTPDCDETDVAVQTGCTPCSTYVRGDEIYEVCTDTGNWLAVNTRCVARGGTLASLGTKAEADFVYDMVTAVDPAVGNWWIGLHDRNDLGASEGNHVWIDGTPVDALDFADGQGNTGDQDCVSIQPQGWNDQPCGDGRRYVCER
jgi:hypothetical protein